MASTGEENEVIGLRGSWLELLLVDWLLLGQDGGRRKEEWRWFLVVGGRIRVDRKR